jgi:hypothetical protein
MNVRTTSERIPGERPVAAAADDGPPIVESG